jgi:hypothetical protein
MAGAMKKLSQDLIHLDSEINTLAKQIRDLEIRKQKLAKKKDYSSWSTYYKTKIEQERTLHKTLLKMIRLKYNVTSPQIPEATINQELTFYATALDALFKQKLTARIEGNKILEESFTEKHNITTIIYNSLIFDGKNDRWYEKAIVKHLNNTQTDDSTDYDTASESSYKTATSEPQQTTQL